MLSLARKEIWFRGIFHLIAILGESPFVSKLRKAESAQHSVHLTGGTLRVFRHFARLEIDSDKIALSRPAHQQVTQTVSLPMTLYHDIAHNLSNSALSFSET